MQKKMIKNLMLVVVMVALCVAVGMTASAESYTEGYYTYIVTDEEATIISVDDSISGDVIIPETLGGYTVTNLSGGNTWNSGFYGCKGVYNVHLPSTIESIGSAFYYTPNLMKITVDEDNPHLTSKDGVLYNKNMSQMLVYPGGKAYDDLIIPATVKIIDGFQYSGNSQIKTLSFEDGSQLEFFNGDSLFYFTDIDELILPASCRVENMELGGSCRVKSLKFVEGRQEEVFANNGEYDSNCSTLGQLKKIELTKSFVGIAEKGLNTGFHKSLETVIINNPQCDIYDSADTIDEGATIYGYENSTAQAYAEKYERNFVALECEHSYVNKYVEADGCNCAYEYNECEICGDIKDKKEFPDTATHSYTPKVTSPTCKSKGYTTYTCSCGDRYVADYINVLEHKDTNGDYKCDYGCGYEFEKPAPEEPTEPDKPKEEEKNFFEKIVEWFKALFDKLFGWMKR